MNYSHLLHSSIPLKQNLLKYGFTEDAEIPGTLVIKKDLVQSEFYSVIKISETEIIVQVYDQQTDERYALFDMPSANGAFVGGLRAEVDQIIADIQEQCFKSTNVYQKYVNFLIETYKCTQDFPWDDLTASVFRCPNDKWFALVMEISYKSLGFNSEEKVWVVNLKADADLIPELVDKKSIYPAYHMNKKYWITILLTDVTNFQQLCDLTARSFNLVMGRNQKSSKV